MEKPKFTFLRLKETRRLDIFKKYGMKSAITDFSILLGGDVSDDEYTNDGYELKNRTGRWWTKSSDGDGNVCIVNHNGLRCIDSPYSWNCGTRPSFTYSTVFNDKIGSSKGIIEIEYGEYPQYIVSSELSKNLEKLYICGLINKTGKTYTNETLYYENYDICSITKKHIEYEYNGKKYIRFIGYANYGELLSNGTAIEEGEPYWIEVSPIKWIVDEMEGMVISKNIVFAGSQFICKDFIYKNRGYIDGSGYTGNFEETDIYEFMNDVFAIDIIPSVVDEKSEIESPEVSSPLEEALIAHLTKKIEQLHQKSNDEKVEQTRLISKNEELDAKIEVVLAPQIEEDKRQYVKK